MAYPKPRSPVAANGYRADLASNGIEAIERRSPDLRCGADGRADAEMDGLSLAPQHSSGRRQRPHRRTRPTLCRAIAKRFGGLDDYLSKLIRLEELVEALMHRHARSEETWMNR